MVNEVVCLLIRFELGDQSKKSFMISFTNEVFDVENLKIIFEKENSDFEMGEMRIRQGWTYMGAQRGPSPP